MNCKADCRRVHGFLLCKPPPRSWELERIQYIERVKKKEKEGEVNKQFWNLNNSWFTFYKLLISLYTYFRKMSVHTIVLMLEMWNIYLCYWCYFRYFGLKNVNALLDFFFRSSKESVLSSGFQKKRVHRWLWEVSYVLFSIKDSLGISRLQG